MGGNHDQELSETCLEGAAAPQVLHLHLAVRHRVHAGRADAGDGAAGPRRRGLSAGDQAREHGRHLLRARCAASTGGATGLPATRCSTSTRATCPTSSRWPSPPCKTACYSYLNGQRLKSYLKRTDGAFWQILDFQFLEGGPYTERDVARPSHRRGHQRSDAPAILRRAAGARPDDRGRRPAVHRGRRRARRADPAAGAVCRHLGAAYHGEVRQLHARVRRRLHGRSCCCEDPSKLRADARRAVVAAAHGQARRPGLRATRRARRRHCSTRSAGCSPATAAEQGAGHGRRLQIALTVAALLFMLLPAVNLDQPEHQPHHGARLGDRRPQGLRRLVAHAGRPVRRRESRAHAGRRRGRASLSPRCCCRSSTAAG